MSSRKNIYIMILKTKKQNLQAITICNLPSKHLQKQDTYIF